MSHVFYVRTEQVMQGCSHFGPMEQPAMLAAMIAVDFGLAPAVTAVATVTKQSKDSKL